MDPLAAATENIRVWSISRAGGKNQIDRDPEGNSLARQLAKNFGRTPAAIAGYGSEHIPMGEPLLHLSPF
jgi:hypothetical protein